MPFRDGCGCSTEISAGWTRNLLLLPDRLSETRSGANISTSRTSPGVINVLAVTMGQSTGYADVDAVLADLLAGVRGTLGPQLVGVYLDGSLATGDFAEHSSDIDVLVVTEDALSDEIGRASCRERV